MTALEKIIQCFKASSDDCLYGRDSEVAAIRRFIDSELSILHIAGSPGTGKTCTVRWALRNTEFVYANYFLEASMNSALKRCLHKIVVIDEFDKYLEEKRAECLKNILLLKSKGRKVITISNTLRLESINFKPYTSSEIFGILKEKVDKELDMHVIEDAALVFLSKKFEKTGDLRSVFKAILNACLKKVSTHTLYEDGKLELRDFVTGKEVVSDKGIHHELIGKIRGTELNRKQAYKNYMKECGVMALMPLSRPDFDLIFDILGGCR